MENLKKREEDRLGGELSDDDGVEEEDLPDYSQWSFERPPPIKLDDEIGKDILEESTATTTEDDDLPDYSNWNVPPTKRTTSLKEGKKERKFLMDEEIVTDQKNSPASSIKQQGRKFEDEELSEQLQQSLSKIKKTMNEEDEFSFIPKKKNQSINLEEKKKKSNKKSSNKFDFSDILFDLESDESSSDEEPLSYEEWKQKQEIKLRNKSPLDMLETLKKMTDTISPIDKPLNPQMTDLEHKLMLEWMFPLCKFKQK